MCDTDPTPTPTPTPTNTPTITNTPTQTPTPTNTPLGCMDEDGVASGNHNIFIVSGTISGTNAGVLIKGIANNTYNPPGRNGSGYHHFSWVCETKAAEAGLTKRYVPLIANNSATGAKSTVQGMSAWDGTGGIYNFGVQIATSWADLWDGSLIAPIRKNQAGVNTALYPITGSSWAGSDFNHCNGWTSNTNAYSYTYGDSSGTSTDAFNTTSLACDLGDATTLSLYCISLKPACTADAAATATMTGTPTNTATGTPTPTFTATNTNTPTSTPTTAAPTNTPTNTPTTAAPTNTNTPTNTPTTAAPTNTPTNTATNTPTNTFTNTPTNTFTNTPTNTFTNTPTNTPTTAAPTSTPTGKPTETNTPTNTPTNTSTFAATPNQTPCVNPHGFGVGCGCVQGCVTATPTPTPIKK